MEVRGVLAVVTGGAVGTGRAIALALAEMGAEVVVVDIDVGGGEDTVRRAPNRRCRFERVDLTRPSEIVELVRPPSR